MDSCSKSVSMLQGQWKKGSGLCWRCKLHHHWSNIIGLTSHITIGLCLNVYRYGNVFCAKCHGVEDILYWKVELSALTHPAGVCEKRLSDFTIETLRTLRSNPTLAQVTDK